MIIIGLMSGTSADGIDAAVVGIDGEARALCCDLLGFTFIPYDPDTRSAILNLCAPGKGQIDRLCALNGWLGERFASAALEAVHNAHVPMEEVSAIASHGQTVWHQPHDMDIAGGRARGTLQIGDPATIAARTGCTVISDFRSADMAAGGQGAPLVPYADWALLTSDEESRIVLNIGGIANMTYLPKGASLEDVIAFDTGPGNMVIDGLVEAMTNGKQHFDQDGKWAAQGQTNTVLLGELMNHPFFHAPPPKSSGREEFGAAYVRLLLELGRKRGIEQCDLLRTATVLTAASIHHQFSEFVVGPNGMVQTFIVGGGGARNHTLVTALAELVKPARVTTHEEFGIPNDAKEAIAFAILGYETFYRRPSNVPTATGASRPMILGSITPGNQKR